jgi:hypothetical protein
MMIMFNGWKVAGAIKKPPFPAECRQKKADLLMTYRFKRR